MGWKNSQRRSVGMVVSGAALCLACASSQDRFDQARLYEAEGRYAEAALEYIDVLSREPEWTDARTALEDVGPLAIDELTERARRARAGNAFEDALESLDRAVRVKAGAQSVGVAFALPTDFASVRADALDGAIEAYRSEGEQAAAVGSWAEAARAYEGAIDLAASASHETRDLARRQAEIHLHWAESRLEAGEARAGFDLAERAATIGGGNGEFVSQVRTFQERALELGSRHVAFLPFSRTKTIDLDAPEGFSTDLNEILELEKWLTPPLFVVPADPIRIRRELRRTGLEGTIIGTRDAAELGRDVDADYVVVGEIVSFIVQERDQEDEIKQARVRADRAPARGAREVNYVERSRRVEYEVEVSYRIVDTRTRRPLRDRRTSQTRSKRVSTARYAGDHSDLELSGSRLEMFTGEAERRDLEDLRHQLADQLAARLASRVFDDLLSEIR